MLVVGDIGGVREECSIMADFLEGTEAVDSNELFRFMIPHCRSCERQRDGSGAFMGYPCEVKWVEKHKREICDGRIIIFGFQPPPEWKQAKGKIHT